MSDVDKQARELLEGAIDAVLAQTQPHAMIAWLSDRSFRGIKVFDGHSMFSLAEAVLRTALDEERLLYGTPGAETPVGLLDAKVVDRVEVNLSDISLVVPPYLDAKVAEGVGRAFGAARPRKPKDKAPADG